MKICHVTSAHSSNDERILEKECVSLAKNKQYQVFLVVKGNSFIKSDVTVVGVGEAPAGRVKRILSFSKKVVKKALELDADVYHLHDPELLQFVPLFKKKGKIVVFDQHENVAASIADKYYIPVFMRKTVTWAYTRYTNPKLQACDALVSVTPHIVEELQKIHDKVYMVTNYPRLRETQPEIPQNTDYHTVLFAGRVAPQWSHDTVIRAIHTIGDMKYELYGHDEDDYVNNVLSTLPGWQQTNYHGGVPFQEVQQALAKGGIAVALLKPNYNTDGMRGTIGVVKLFECMLAGLPVICTGFETWNKIIEGGHCGICIAPDDEKALIEALTYLRDHPAEARQMGENGRALVNSTYNWQTQEKVLYEMYAYLEERRQNGTK